MALDDDYDHGWRIRRPGTGSFGLDRGRSSSYRQVCAMHQRLAMDPRRRRAGGPGEFLRQHHSARFFCARPLIGGTNLELGIMPPDAVDTLHDGLDRVRFMSPVKAGARVRNRVELLGAERAGCVSISTRHFRNRGRI